MRLTTIEQETIHQAITAVDPNAEIYLFGSRTDDQARGGDIDLFVLSNHIDLMNKLEILAQLHRHLGEQKIDVMIESDTAHPLAQIATKSGIRL